MTPCASTSDVWGCTERGPRSSHEDAVDHRPGPETAVYCVADGVGQHQGGNVAAERAVQAVVDFAPGPGRLVDIAHAGMALAHDLVLDEQQVSKQDCRTTLALLLVRGTQAVVAHVGDSRVYRLRPAGTQGKDRIFQPTLLTRDHRDAAGVLVRSLGSRRGGDSATPDVRETDALPGDVFALVTDGVWTVLGHEGVTKTLADAQPRLGARWMAEELVHRALERGSTDNCTALVVRVPGGAL